MPWLEDLMVDMKKALETVVDAYGNMIKPEGLTEKQKNILRQQEEAKKLSEELKKGY